MRFLTAAAPVRTSDQRQILNLGYVLDLPYLTNHRSLIGKLAGGWQLSGLTSFQTGTPFSVTAGNGQRIHTGAGVSNGGGKGHLPTSLPSVQLTSHD